MNQSNYEPMEVDLSTHSNNAMDISYNSSSSANDIDAFLEADDFQIPPAMKTPVPALSPTEKRMSFTKTAPANIKKFHIIMQKEKKKYASLSLKAKMMCSVFIILLSILTYQVVNIQCSDDLGLDVLKNTLSEKLFGQSRAINSLMESLSVSEKTKLLFLYGGTGVGKTLTASSILEHIGRYSNVYHYVMPSFMDTFTTDFMIGLSVCQHTTVIVDDLTARDMRVRSHIQDLITKSQSLNKDITIILIFNCDNAAEDFERKCDDSFSEKLLQNFKDIDAFKKMIKFEPLTEEHLKLCMETEMGNKKISDIEFKKLVKHFNVSQDGCKGVYTKMKMLDIS